MLYCDALTGHHVSAGSGNRAKSIAFTILTQRLCTESVDMVRAVCRICTYNGQFIYELCSASRVSLDSKGLKCVCIRNLHHGGR